MSLMTGALRRNWRITGAIIAFFVFVAIHFLLFRPAASRYKAALAEVGGIEAVFNPGGTTVMLPPHLFSLIAEQSLTAQDAVDRGASGALGVSLLEETGRMASHSGLMVTASEPGVLAQQPQSVLVRAHLTMRGRYPQVVSFFDELSRSGALILIDRLSISPVAEDMDELEIWVSRVYLKKPAAKS